ncbi:Histone-lysine N-methyltransferase SETMAR [Habropoda laboriosa]|uniref:Histone-lysine N-methyltransferase SETMAR n=1 Tax=Habropoda laboriosa TaxID=597456 RepID=A0A0L7QZK1_9HYME|nr:Histone-lysine N-methyltransferase SETMAR [Habropoda laboriosa]
MLTVSLQFPKTRYQVAESYCNELEVVHEKLKGQQPTQVDRRGPILLHHNARSHIANTTAQKLHQLAIEDLHHPAYSPDFHFFPSLDNFLTQKRFRKQKDTENAFGSFFSPGDSHFYICKFNALAIHWPKCVKHDGNYFK